MNIKKKITNSRNAKNDSASIAHVHQQNNAKNFCIDDREAYYFDRISINCMPDINEVEKKLPINSLKKECSELYLRESHLNWVGYETTIDVIAPTKKFLQMLSKDKLLQDTEYKISSIEIAHDIFYPSEHEAEYASYKIFSTIGKKYSRGFVYDEDKAAKRKTANKRKHDYFKRGLFSHRAFYSDYEKENVEDGARRKCFKLVIYARLSKLNRKPCIHFEWRIIKADQIRERTSIRTIRDLLHYNFQKFFQKTEKKYMTHKVLNTKKIGRVLAGLERRRKLNKSQLLHVDLAYATLRSHYDIKSVSDFTSTMMKERRCLAKQRGRKSLWARQIKKLSNISLYLLPYNNNS